MHRNPPTETGANFVKENAFEAWKKTRILKKSAARAKKNAAPRDSFGGRAPGADFSATIPGSCFCLGARERKEKKKASERSERAKKKQKGNARNQKKKTKEKRGSARAKC